MKIIIAGAGAVGTHLAKLLSREKQDIILMDDNEEKLSTLSSVSYTHLDVYKRQSLRCAAFSGSNKSSFELHDANSTAPIANIPKLNLHFIIFIIIKVNNYNIYNWSNFQITKICILKQTTNKTRKKLH